MSVFHRFQHFDSFIAKSMNNLNKYNNHNKEKLLKAPLINKQTLTHKKKQRKHMNMYNKTQKYKVGIEIYLKKPAAVSFRTPVGGHDRVSGLVTRQQQEHD